MNYPEFNAFHEQDSESNHYEYQHRINKSYQLLPAYSYLSGTPLKKIRQLADALVDKPTKLSVDVCGESGLNADQSPLQLCITATPEKIQCRLIADPSTDEPVPEQRYTRSQQALEQVIHNAKSYENASIISALLTNFGPQNGAPANLFTRGVFWLGASAEQPGLAIYTDTSMHDVNIAWDKAESYICSLSSGAALKTIRSVREYCWLSSIGIEGSTPDNSRIKLYARMHTLLPSGLIGNLFPPVNELTRSGCFSAIIGEKGLTCEDILFNFGFHMASGELEDIKVDISGSSLQMGGGELANVVDQICHKLELRAIPIKALFDRFNIATSFVGVAITAHGKKRLNVYLKGGSL